MVHPIEKIAEEVEQVENNYLTQERGTKNTQNNA